jgi:hypothetical protein
MDLVAALTAIPRTAGVSVPALLVGLLAGAAATLAGSVAAGIVLLTAVALLGTLVHQASRDRRRDHRIRAAVAAHLQYEHGLTVHGPVELHTRGARTRAVDAHGVAQRVTVSWPAGLVADVPRATPGSVRVLTTAADARPGSLAET